MDGTVTWVWLPAGVALLAAAGAVGLVQVERVRASRVVLYRTPVTSAPRESTGAVMADGGAPGLSAEQLAEVLPLIKAADSVELKLTVPEASRRSAVAALDMDPLDAQIRQVDVLRHPRPHPQQAGPRASASDGSRVAPGDSIVKLRPVVPADIPAKRAGSHRASASRSTPCRAGSSAPATMRPERRRRRGRRRCSTASSRRGQAPSPTNSSRFYAVARPARPGGRRRSHASGRSTSLKLKFSPTGFGRRVVAELWTYPDGSRILELSTEVRADGGVRGGGGDQGLPDGPRHRPPR